MAPLPSRDDGATLALLPWGNVLEDFLETAEISLEEFLGDFVGSWMFGYVDATARAGVKTVLVCVSRQVDAPRHERHGATGADVVLLPPTSAYRFSSCRRPLLRWRASYAGLAATRSCARSTNTRGSTSAPPSAG